MGTLSMESERWEFWIDVGGTFTDCLARCPDGTLQRQKLLSSGLVPGSIRSLVPDGFLAADAGYLPDQFWQGSRLIIDPPGGDQTARDPMGRSDFSNIRPAESRLLST